MHSVMEIEEKIRQRYCQPTGVEQFGIEPVPPKLKTVRWHDIFAIIFELALNPGSMLVGGMGVVCGLSFWGAIGAITAGILLATIAYTITATVVVDYRLPGQVFDAHGLWLARCQIGAVVFAHNSFDVLVCLPDNGRLPRRRRDPAPMPIPLGHRRARPAATPSILRAAGPKWLEQGAPPASGCELGRRAVHKAIAFRGNSETGL